MDQGIQEHQFILYKLHKNAQQIEENQKDLDKSKKKSKKSVLYKWGKRSQVLVQLAFHYMDIVTDMMLILEVYGIYIVQQAEYAKYAWLQVFLFLVILMCVERINSFLHIRQVLLELENTLIYIEYSKKEKQWRKYNKVEQEVMEVTWEESKKKINNNQDSQNQDNQKPTCDIKHSNSIKQTIVSFFLVITYIDFAYMTFQSQNIDNRKNIIQKQVIELFTENMEFLIISYNVLQYQILLGQGISNTVMISFTLSFLSCNYIGTLQYLYRMKNSHLYQPKHNQNFRNFDIQTKLFVSNPSQLNPLKILSYQIDKYPQLLKSEYRKELNKALMSQNVIKETPVKIYELIYVFLVQFNYGVTILLLSVLPALTKQFFPIYFWFIIGYGICCPQVFIHFLQIIKYWKIDKKECILKLFYLVIFIPLQMIFGTLATITPVKTEQVPFLKKTKETWATHSLPTIYLVVARQVLFSIFFNNVSLVVMHGTNIRPDWPQFMQDNMTDPDGMIRDIYNIVYYNFWIWSTINFFTVIDQLIQQYYDGPLNQEQEIVQENIKNLMLSKQTELQKEKHFQNGKDQKEDQRVVMDLKKYLKTQDVRNKAKSQVAEVEQNLEQDEQDVYNSDLEKSLSNNNKMELQDKSVKFDQNSTQQQQQQYQQQLNSNLQDIQTLIQSSENLPIDIPEEDISSNNFDLSKNRFENCIQNNISKNSQNFKDISQIYNKSQLYYDYESSQQNLRQQQQL